MLEVSGQLVFVAIIRSSVNHDVVSTYATNGKIQFGELVAKIAAVHNSRYLYSYSLAHS